MKSELKVVLTVIFSLALASMVSASGLIFSIQFEDQDDWEANDGRRYTTFNTSAGNFDGSLLDANGDPVGPIGDFIGTNVGTTNNNSGGNNPGPGFAYIPTGVAWEPNMVYSIDFIVLQRAGMPVNSDVQYGLWAGLPSDDTGPGNYLTPDPDDTYEAQDRPSLGTEGLVKITSGFLNDGDGVFVSDLSGTSIIDQAFTFTTGSDVSELGDMVLFVRTDTDRIHWDSLSVSAVPEPGTYAFIVGFLAFAGAVGVRRIRSRKG
jgi:hypothetical protein